MKPFKHVLLSIVGLILLVIVLASCEDLEPRPDINGVSYRATQGTCAVYTLQVDWEGLEGEVHTLRMMRPNSQQELASQALAGEKGPYFWENLTCDSSSVLWNAEENACIFEIEISSGGAVSDREEVRIEC